jgi:hypothetical protein
VGGAEGVHDVDVAERGVLLGQGLVVLLLALVEAHVLQQHQLAVGDLGGGLQIVLDQPHLAAELGAEIRGDRRQRVLLGVDALFRTAPGAT